MLLLGNNEGHVVGEFVSPASLGVAVLGLVDGVALKGISLEGK